MKTFWILVANEAEAQIYSSDRLPGDILLVDVLKNEAGTTHPRDLVSDAPGRAYDSVGAGRHAMEPNTGIKVERRRRFVKEMAERLRTAHLKGEFQQLVLLAAPAVLGVLRKSLTADLAKNVTKEIPKDVIGQGVDKIRLQLERATALR